MTARQQVKRGRRYPARRDTRSTRGNSRGVGFFVWIRPRIIYLLLLLALGWGGYQLLTSPTFKISKISILNNRLSTSQEIVEASGLNDENVFLLNKDKTKSSLATLPTIKDVELVAHLPNEVTIKVLEHPPVYVWRARERSYLVSEEGVVIGISSDDQGQLISIVDLDNQPLNRGDRLDKAALNAARQLNGLLPKQVSIAPKYFEFSRSLGIVVSTDSYRIAFGLEENLDVKLDELKAILKAISEKKASATLIDLRVIGKPYLK